MKEQQPTVVVVDDEEEHRLLARTTLERAGLEVRDFATAEDALQAMQEDGPPAVIITDLHMSGLDGWRFCHLMRSPAFAELNEVPVLAVSGVYTGDETESTLQAVGADDFLPAPYAPEDLRQRVERLIGGRPTRRPERVLVVEDNDAVARLVTAVFEHRGYEAATVATLAEAREAANRVCPAIMVVDYHLPDGDGDGLLDAVGSGSTGPVCVFMTADDAPELATHLLRRGADAYVRKPFDPDYLVALCENARRERALVRVDALIKRRERESAQSEAEKSLILDSMSEQVVFVGNDGRVRWANRAAVESLGADGGEMVGKPCREVFGDALTAVVCSPLEDGRPVSRAVTDATGRSFDVRARAVCVGTDVVGVVAIMRDTTSEKDMELALERSRGAASTVLDTMDDMAVLTDPEGIILDMNQAAARKLCVEPQNVIGACVYDLLEPEWAERCRSINEEVIATGESASFEGEDGPQVIEVCIHPVLDAGGAVIALTGLGRDVTEIRERQRLEVLRGRLSAVGQLATGIAHDFNNALSPVVGYAELLLRRQDLPADVRDKLQVMLDQGLRAAKLTRQILDFSRQTVIRKRSLDLAKLVREAHQMLRPMLPESIDVQTMVEPGSYNISGDEAQVQQILLNLALNARDAMPEGGCLEIRLRLRDWARGEERPFPQMADGVYAELMVSDTGVGMDSEVCERVFEPFFTTKEVGQGSGMGLAQVYGIVKQHGGFIDVTSQPGSGTKFLIYLPLLEPEQSHESGKQTPSLATGAGETVLIVEDNDMVRGVLVDVLEALGYRTVTAANGAEALQVFDEHTDEIRVALTDIVMPEMGGRRFVDELHARGAAVKVIALTGYPLGTEPGGASTAGFFGWLTKPPSISDLADMVAAAIKAG